MPEITVADHCTPDHSQMQICADLPYTVLSTNQPTNQPTSPSRLRSPPSPSPPLCPTMSGAAARTKLSCLLW